MQNIKLKLSFGCSAHKKTLKFWKQTNIKEMNILDELSGDNESEPFVLNESVLALNRLWMNETNSPDILIYNEDLVHPLMKDLKAQQVDL